MLVRESPWTLIRCPWTLVGSAVPPISVRCHPSASSATHQRPLSLSLSLGSAHLGRQSVRHLYLFMLPDVSAALYLYLMAFLRFPLFLLFLLFPIYIQAATDCVHVLLDGWGIGLHLCRPWPRICGAGQGREESVDQAGRPGAGGDGRRRYQLHSI